MVIITGTIAYDYIMNFPGSFGDHIAPQKIRSLNLSFIVNKFERRRGGTAGNVSYTMALLGSSHTLLATAGKDFGEYQQEFNKLKIDLSNVAIDKENYTSTGFAMTDNVNNQVWGYFYGASEKNKELRIKNIAGEKDMVLVGPTGAKGSMNFVKQCIQSKLDYMFDPGFVLTQITDKDLLMGVENAKYLIGNDYEINVIKKRIKNWKKIFSLITVITTLGSKGSLVESKGKKESVKSAKVIRAVDPTGAGDAWRGGFLTGLQKDFDIKICAQMGSVAASFAVEKYGSQEHKYTKKEFIKRYRQNFNSLIEL
jgi:adenosine kinase